MNPLGRLRSSQIGRRLLHDNAFRGGVGIYQGMAINFVYAAFRAVTGVLYSSVFSVTTAVYYLLLGIMRADLAYAYRRRAENGGLAYELRCCRRTAWLLLLLNIPTGGLILLMIRKDPSGVYPGYTIYASATYTFYMMVLSVINVVKFRKLGSPILSAAKVLNFIAALVSVLGLQNALISKFSDSNEEFRVLMNTLTGTGVYIAVIISAICMIVLTRRAEKGTRHNEQIRK